MAPAVPTHLRIGAPMAPAVPTHLRIGAPMAPASLDSSPTSRRFQRLERLARDQLAVKGGGQHQQDVGRQAGEVVIPRFVLAPAAADLLTHDWQGVLAGGAFRVTDREPISLRFQSSHFGLELVNLAAQTRLPAIKGAGIQKERTPDLVAIPIDHADGDEHAYAPIETQNALDILIAGLPFHRHLDREIEHRVAGAIGLDDLSQRGSQRRSLPGASHHEVRHLHLYRPRSLFVGSAQGKRQGLLLQIEPQAVGLAYDRSVVTSIGQDPCFEHRNGLHLFVGRGETAVLEVEVARLLDQT